MRFTALLFTSFLTLLCQPVWAASGIAASPEEVTPLLDGTTIPNSQVFTADGEAISLIETVKNRPAIIVFYRGGWCPYCNRQLAELKDIESDLVAMGYQILAISPESVERLNAQKLKTEMQATILSDHTLSAVTDFGIAYYVDKATSIKYAGYNIVLTKDKTGQPVLPAPAIFIVDKQGRVQFSYVNPNYQVRPSAELVKQVAKALKATGMTE